MTDTQAPDVVVTEAPVDGGFDGASVEAAETLWACLPHVRKWTSLATHEKALVIHTFARLSTQSAMQARIEELEADLSGLLKWADNVCRARGIATGQLAVERARAALSSAIGEQHEFSGWVEVVDEGEIGNDAIAAIGGDRG